jgi:hypothetical protein
MLLLVGVGGCSDETGPAGAAPESAPAVTGSAATTTPAPDPTEALRAAAEALARVSYNFEFNPGLGDSGRAVVAVTDPVARQARLYFPVGPADARPRPGLMVLRIGNNLWLQASGVPGLPTKWMSVDRSRLKKSSRWLLTDFADPTRVLAALRTATAVTGSAETSFSGRIDTTAVPGGFGTAADRAAAGAAAKAAPCTVSLDDDGWIDQVTITLGAKVYTLDVAGPGRSADLVRPAPAQTVRAPALLYSVLNA